LRNELHELVDQLPEAKVALVPRLVHGEPEDVRPAQDLAIRAESPCVIVCVTALTLLPT
jgi:hypothetical protein